MRSFRNSVRLMGLALLFSASVFAQVEPNSQPTPDLPKSDRIEPRTFEINRHRALLRRKGVRSASFAPPAGAVRLFVPFEKTGIVAMSGEISLFPEADQMKRLIAENLPAGVKLLLTVKNENKRRATLERYSRWIDPSRLMFATIGIGPTRTLWARDALPMPVIGPGAGPRGWAVIDAKYLPEVEYEPDTKIAETLDAPLFGHEFIYPGGNLIGDGNGNCFRVKSTRGAGMPAQAYREYYGCRSLTEFTFKAGIGDVDERVAFLSPTLAVTDLASYAEILKEKGYQVVRLPRPTGKGTEFETYANFLLVNGTAFLPIFGAPEDEKAIRTLEGLGLKVFASKQTQVSREGWGNVHCYTMNYPVIDPADRPIPYPTHRARFHR